MDSDVAHTVHALSVELRTEYPQGMISLTENSATNIR